MTEDTPSNDNAAPDPAPAAPAFDVEGFKDPQLMVTETRGMNGPFETTDIRLESTLDFTQNEAGISLSEGEEG